MNNVFLEDFKTEKSGVVIEASEIKDPAALINYPTSEKARALGDEFANEIDKRMISDFKRDGDLMVHVSTYAVIDGMIYMTYYANRLTESEDPKCHSSRLAYCKLDEPENKVFIDLQTAGDDFHGKKVEAVYDTILMHKDKKTLYLMWTANLDGNYYRLYRTFDISAKSLGDIKVNRLNVSGILSDFSITAMQASFAECGIGYKKMYTDIGIMQKITPHVENGVTYYYTGAYCGDCNFIIKSKDFETWEYVSSPDFLHLSKWENAVYVKNDKCYYFVRQDFCTDKGFLCYYDLKTQKWSKCVLVDDCQSRSDFIEYNDKLYVFHAPIDREHIGLIYVDTEDLSKSKPIFEAKMNESCFYPFINYGDDGRLYFSYTSERKHIRMSVFEPEKYM